MKIRKILSTFILFLSLLLLSACDDNDVSTFAILDDIVSFNGTNYYSRNGTFYETQDNTFVYKEKPIPLEENEFEENTVADSVLSSIPVYGIEFGIDRQSKALKDKNITGFSFLYGGYEFCPLEKPKEYTPIFDNINYPNAKQYQYYQAYHSEWYKNWWIPFSAQDVTEYGKKFTKNYIKDFIANKDSYPNSLYNCVVLGLTSIVDYDPKIIENGILDWFIELYVDDNLVSKQKLIVTKENNYLPIKQKVKFQNIQISKRNSKFKIVIDSKFTDILSNNLELALNNLTLEFTNYQLLLDSKLENFTNLSNLLNLDVYEYHINGQKYKSYPLIANLGIKEIGLNLAHYQMHRYSKLNLTDFDFRKE